MDGPKYRAILEENVLESDEDHKLGQRFTFQQDNPRPKAKSIM